MGNIFSNLILFTTIFKGILKYFLFHSRLILELKRNLMLADNLFNIFLFFHGLRGRVTITTENLSHKWINSDLSRILLFYREWVIYFRSLNLNLIIFNLNHRDGKWKWKGNWLLGNARRLQTEKIFGRVIDKFIWLSMSAIFISKQSHETQSARTDNFRRKSSHNARKIFLLNDTIEMYFIWFWFDKKTNLDISSLHLTTRHSKCAPLKSS